MKKRLLIPVSILLLCTVQVPKVVAFENERTHKAMTKKAVERSVLAGDYGDYLQTQLGLSSGLETELQLTETFKDRIDMRVSQSPASIWDETILSIKQWVIEGSSLEDVPLARGRHHFHDPISNAGLRNSKGPLWAVEALKFFSKRRYPDYHAYDGSGESNPDMALAVHAWSEPSPVGDNRCDWLEARLCFYDAVTEEAKSDREEYLGNMFLVLGHLCHFLQDVGVPAHARNDWIWAHTLGGSPTYWGQMREFKWLWDGGNPFEIWLENQISGETIPGRFVNGKLMASPPAFAKVEHYWDTDTCVESGIPQWQGSKPGWGNPPPEKDWGLAECSNYQFLSYSTIFKKNDTRMYQSFPHPAKGNVRERLHTKLIVGVGYNVKHYYYCGYDVPHLARVTYTERKRLTGKITKSSATCEDKEIWEDYAARTVPRTIDYTTGLINYFFRGRLSVAVDEDSFDCDGQVEILITNNSVNSDLDQTLKGGTFELYWDDATGNRTKITPLTVFSSETAGPTWNSSTTTLDKGSSVRARFAVPDAEDVDSCILVYNGNICEDPAEIDPDDQSAIAVSDTFVVTADYECPSCERCPGCAAEYGYDGALCCFDEGEVPKYLCATFSGIKLCRDDSTVPTFSVCCEQKGSTGNDRHEWNGSCTIDGEVCTVNIDWSGSGWDSFIHIWGSSKRYYYGRCASFCNNCDSDIVKSGGSYDCDTEWGDGLDTGGYGGEVDICIATTGAANWPC